MTGQPSLWVCVARILGLTQLPTLGAYPQTNGLTENLNRTLKQILSKIVTKGGKDWDEPLGPVLFTYKTASHSSTAGTPFSLLHGRDPSLRVPTSIWIFSTSHFITSRRESVC